MENRIEKEEDVYARLWMGFQHHQDLPGVFVFQDLTFKSAVTCAVTCTQISQAQSGGPSSNISPPIGSVPKCQGESSLPDPEHTWHSAHRTEATFGELLKVRSEFCTAVYLAQGVTCCWGHRKACCSSAFCRHSSPVTSHLMTWWQSHHSCRDTHIFRAMELPPVCATKAVSKQWLSYRLLTPGMLPLFLLPLKPNLPPALEELKRDFFLLPKWDSLSFTMLFWALTPSCASYSPSDASM